MSALKPRLIALLRWSERYTKTDMVYLVKSNFWIQASSTFVSFGSFLLYIVFGHVLPKEVYGTYQYFLSIGAIITAFTMTGMSAAVTRAVAQGFEGTYAASIKPQLVWGIVPMLGSWILAAYYFNHANSTLGMGLLLIGLFIPWNTTFNTFAAYLTAKKDFRRGFFFSLLINVPYFAAMALVAVSMPAAIALLAANLISQAIGYYIAHRKILARLRTNDPVDPDAFRYGTHLSIVNVIGSVMAQVDNILVFHLLGAAPLALYSFVTAIPDRLGMFKNLAATAFPKYAVKTHADIRKDLVRKLTLSIAASLVIAIAYAVLAQTFFALFFPQYLDAVPYSRLYAIITAVGFSPVFIAALTAHGRTRELYILNIFSPLVQVLCVAVGILLLGLWGLVIGRILSALLSSVAAFGLFLSSDHQHV